MLHVDSFSTVAAAPTWRRRVAQPLLYSRQPEQRSRWLAELGELLAFPTVSAQPGCRPAIGQAARWLAQHLTALGLRHAQVLPGPHGAAPSVYADWLEAPGQPTLLLYGHFDVQPAEPLAAWRTSPFRATIKGQNLYARGASDDKGQLFIHLKALESHLLATGRLPVNVKLWLEGEEEINSPNLSALLDREGERLHADAVVISDTEMAAPGRPSIVYGLRGTLACEIEVSGPARDLHAGRYGGAVLNPLHALCAIVANLHDRQGRIAVPGFYRSVRAVSQTERQMLCYHAPSDAALLARLGLTVAWGEPGYSMAERITIRPSLTVTEISTSNASPGAGAAAIPSHACARLNIRLVPDQDPTEISGLLRQRVAALTPAGVRACVAVNGTSRPVLIPRRGAAMSAAARAVTATWGRAPVFTRSGGSIAPVEQLHRRLGVPVVLLGFGLPDDNIHAANEKIHLPTLFRGVETISRFLAEYAR